MCMDHLNFAEFNEEVINVNKITKITYDESLDKYAISIDGETLPVMISREQHQKFINHLKKVSNSYFNGIM